jgi:hypothetical protein
LAHHHHHDDEEGIESRGVVVLGDHETGDAHTVLTDNAGHHGAAVIDIITFAPNTVGSQNDLDEAKEVVAAVSLAIRSRADVWVPFPGDLGREQHLRRLSLVLQRHGLNLRIGQHLWPCPRTGGLSEADFALRQEVRAVDDLDRAVLAAAGVEVLNTEIEQALASTFPMYQTAWPEQLGKELGQLEHDYGPGPALPLPTAAWRYRQPGLKRYADWLVNGCGLTQSDAARIINAAGHRTPQGRNWQQATVSALIRGGYDRGAA